VRAVETADWFLEGVSVTRWIEQCSSQIEASDLAGQCRLAWEGGHQMMGMDYDCSLLVEVGSSMDHGRERANWLQKFCFCQKVERETQLGQSG
jgi:hypothetical protein